MLQHSSTTTVQLLVITHEQAGQRLDNFLFKRFKRVPKSRIYRAIRNGEVRINGGRVKPLYKLHYEDKLRLPPLQQYEQLQPVHADLRLPQQLLGAILYEDDKVLILNKPSGLAVHGGSGIHQGIIEVLRQVKPAWQALELVHRLDRATSGCLILAKKRRVLRELHAQWRNRQAIKIYHCLVKGRWRGGVRKIKHALLKNQLSSGERVVKVDGQGQEALTEFRPLQCFEQASLLEVQLHTGRTHQIRVHAASIKHPLVGDDKYGDKTFNQIMASRGLKRLFLHAHRLQFQLDAQVMKIEAPLSDELQQVLNRLDVYETSYFGA